MSYMHIENLYKNQDILLFKECYALEKIHGTSSHITYKSGRIAFFAGGTSHENFCALFDHDSLKQAIDNMALGDNSITIYGEAYGGKLMGMSKTYGNTLKFIAFEVKIGDSWLSVPKAEVIVKSLGLEYVAYVRIPATIETIDAQRDALSVQAERNGMGQHPREGIVLRPIEEVVKNNGERIIAKHKGAAFSETATPRSVNPDALKLIAGARAIATEWVTFERLRHVLDSTKLELKIENTGNVIVAMTEDILREARGEIVDSLAARKEINRATALLFKQILRSES